MKVLKIFLFLFLSLWSQCLWAASPIEEAYDLNTEIILVGEIKEIFIPERGMVYFEVEKNNKGYSVLIAPRWYYLKLNLPFKVEI